MNVILSIIIGALIATANFLAIVYIAKGIIHNSGGKLRFGILAGSKFILLIVLFFVLISSTSVNVIALLAGFTITLLILIIFFPRFCPSADKAGDPMI